MKTHILSEDDVRNIVKHVGIDAFMDEIIASITLAIERFDAQKTPVRMRDGFHYQEPEMGLVEWMPTLDPGGMVTIKIVGYHPANPQKLSLPTILSTISTYDTASGHLVGLADGTFLTAMRTGAVSGIASRILASPDSSTVGLIGLGAQAITQLHAITRLFSIEKVLLHDADDAVSAAFLDRVNVLDLKDVAFSVVSMETLVSSSDILCTATSIKVGEGPLFDDIETRPWLHVNAAGSDFAGKVELPLSLLRNSLVCPDLREQAVREGECQQLSPSEIGPDLAELVKNPEVYKVAQNRLTVFDSTGWALEDRVAMEVLMKWAETLNLGTRMKLEAISSDAKNPYAFLSD